MYKVMCPHCGEPVEITRKAGDPSIVVSKAEVVPPVAPVEPPEPSENDLIDELIGDD